MKLYLLRHGKADWPDWDEDDDLRPLTEEGIAEMEKVAAALKRLKLEPGAILSSPLPRALQTAEIAAKALGLAVEQEDALRPGMDAMDFVACVAERQDRDLMIVGHEPDFSVLLLCLTGARVKFPKAAIAAVELSEELEEPRLLWLFPAKTLIRLYG
jgi:phosphohistidine phosphatase